MQAGSARPVLHKKTMSNKYQSSPKPAETPKVDPPTVPAVEFKDLIGTKQFVRTNSGNMTHLFTSVVFSTEPRRVVVDEFLVVQLEAEKLVISED